MAAGGGRYWSEGVRGECCRFDGRFRISERLGGGRVRMGMVVSGVVCVGTSLALGEVLREVWVGELMEDSVHGKSRRYRPWSGGVDRASGCGIGIVNGGGEG